MKKIFIILFMFAVVCQADAEVVYIQRYQDTDMEWRDIGNRTAWPWQYNLEIAPGVNVEAQIPTTSYSIMELSILSEGNFGWTAWTGMLLMDNFLYLVSPKQHSSHRCLVILHHKGLLQLQRK